MQIRTTLGERMRTALFAEFGRTDNHRNEEEKKNEAEHKEIGE